VRRRQEGSLSTERAMRAVMLFERMRDARGLRAACDGAWFASDAGMGRTTMSFKGALVVGLVAVTVCAGCAAGTGTVEGQASPLIGDSGIEKCDSGIYNRAAGLCVSAGP
jgi:hypothetical protein